MQRIGRFIISQPFAIACVIALAAIGYYLYGTRSQPHHVRAVFSNAVSMTSGLDVQIDGVDVGKVGEVEYDNGRAIVEVGINDDAWPLSQGTTARLRFGTTLGNGTRRVELEPGPDDAPDIPEDGIIPITHTQSPVEFDQLFNTLDADTRDRMQSSLGRTADAVKPHSDRLNEGLRTTPGALEGAADIFDDLGRDDVALRALVANGDRAMRTLAARRAEISSLVDVAATTFDTFATHANGIRSSLEQFAPALSEARTTLARLDTSVDKLDALVDDVRPGAKALRPFAADARPALAQLSRAMPVAVNAVRTAKRTAPDLQRLLEQGQPFARRLDPAMDKLVPHLACVRPYAPEIAGFLSNWASFTQSYDGHSHFDRVKVNAGPTSFNTLPDLKTDTFLGVTGLKYAMPRPPGLDTGKPWFIEECGAGPDALDPSKDPEDR